MTLSSATTKTLFVIGEQRRNVARCHHIGSTPATTVISPLGVKLETLLTGTLVARVIAAAITPGPIVCPAPPGAVIVTVSPANELLAETKDTVADTRILLIILLTLI